MRGIRKKFGRLLEMWKKWTQDQQILIVLRKERNHPAVDSVQGISGESRETQAHQGIRSHAFKTTEGSGGGNHGNRTNSHPAMGGL